MYDIIIKEDAEKQEILMIENGFLTERMMLEKNQHNIEGNIYIGKVQNVLPGLQAAFIDIGEDKNTFIHLKDILPKVDESQEKSKENEISIKDVIKTGDTLIVQVKRAESNRKGARVSTHINLSGKYLVLMPNADFITISQKIEKDKERKRLKELFERLLPNGMGAIIRTSAENKDESAISEDINRLVDNWNTIRNKINKNKTIPNLIHKGNSIIERVLNDIDTGCINSIIVDNEKTYDSIKKITQDIPNIKVSYEKKIIVQHEIEKYIDDLDKRKIWLKCGGFITIDKTEALTAIDVNSGKYIGTKNLEQTVYTVNKEATIEIAKQLKLRDIGGIIIIDYIDMHLQENKDKIEDLLKEELKKDRSKTQVLGFTKLNLLEMTRKHIN